MREGLSFEKDHAGHISHHLHKTRKPGKSWLFLFLLTELRIYGI